MKTGRVTLLDIARRAGVSRTAVSYALRDDPNIAPATRLRIRQAADELGYRPDPLLAKLMAHLHAGRKGRYEGKLALLNLHEDRDFLRQAAALRDFFQSAVARAGALGYETEEFWLHEPHRSPKRLAQILSARGIRGLVVGSTGRHGSTVEFPWEGFAAVTVGYSLESPALHRVVTHHYRNARRALREVEARGYRRVGLVVNRETEAAMEDLHLAAFLAYQQTLPEARRVRPLVLPAFAAPGIGAWFAAERPDVVLSTGPGRAAFAAEGIRVPADVGLARLLLWDEDDGDAGVRPGYERLGAEAVNLLAGQLQRDEFGVPDDPKIVQVEGRWCDGASLPGR